MVRVRWLLAIAALFTGSFDLPARYAATSTATVTVNNQGTYRRGDYYRGELYVTNGTAAAWMGITNTAVITGGTEDIVTNRVGNVFVPQTPEAFKYDADGNLTNDGRWSYSWDAENRLVTMTSNTDVPSSAKLKIDLAYDYRNRRITKRVSTWNGSSYVSAYTNKFLYDGWNLIAELNQSNGVVRTFLWGADLSGSMQGAGGVGGLLAVTVTTNGTHFPAFDGNGNVSALVSASAATQTAGYEFGPFGEVIRAEGTGANSCPVRFSTKYQDPESDLLYFGERYYSAATGRWLSRDPIGERGGVNLYGFVRNSPQNHIDPLGLDVNVITGTLTYKIPCCEEKDKVEIGLIVRGKYSEQHNPGVMAQHADVTLADGSLVGFFGSGGGHSGFGMTGVVADKAWFDANRPFYNNAELAKEYRVVSTYCTLRVCPDVAKKFGEAWKNLSGNPPDFSIMGWNCSTRAGGCFQAAGILDGGISGLDTPNHLFRELKAKYGSNLKCQTGFFGYDPSGNPHVIPLPPGAPTSPNTKNTSDVTVSQGTPSSN